MKERLLRLRERIDVLSGRERVLLFVSAAALLYALWNAVLMQPLEREKAQQLHRMEELRTAIKGAEAQIRVLASEGRRDPNAEARARIQALERELDGLAGRLGMAAEDVVSPREMASVLEEVLARTGGLELVAMESLGASPVVSSGEGAEMSGIFRHGMLLVVEGTYLAILDYLHELQRLPGALLWESMDMETVDYPRVRVAIVVNTLSLDEEWIGV